MARDGTFKRHITQGITKYRGSTSGAVMSERVVVKRSIRTNEVVGPACSLSLIIFVDGCSGESKEGFLGPVLEVEEITGSPPSDK